jgi:hypothetical protein
MCIAARSFRQLLDRRRPREATAALRRRPEAALELPDEALELADPLADPRRYATESEGNQVRQRAYRQR